MKTTIKVLLQNLQWSRGLTAHSLRRRIQGVTAGYFNMLNIVSHNMVSEALCTADEVYITPKAFYVGHYYYRSVQSTRL